MKITNFKTLSLAIFAALLLTLTGCDKSGTPSDNGGVVGESANININKDVSNLTPYVGDNVTFTLTVGNRGPNDAIDVGVLDTLPTGYTYVSSNTVTGNYTSATGIWEIGTLANGATATLDIVASVNASGEYINEASAISITPDPDLGDNQDGISTSPIASADLNITKTVDTETPTVGENVIFTLIAGNSGPSNATDVNVTDTLPTGYTYVSDTGSGDYNITTGIWRVGTLANSATVTLDIEAAVNASGTYSNQASISSAISDPNSSNDQDSVSTSPIASADLNITKTVDNTTPTIGDNVIFTLTVGNSGPSNATDVNVTDKLPTGYTYISHAHQGEDYNVTTGIWRVGPLGNGVTATLDINVTVNASGIYLNEGNAISVTSDPDTTNNEDSNSTTPVVALASSGIASVSVLNFCDDGNNEELWTTDGTALGTVLLKDINQGVDGSQPQYVTMSNGTAYFNAYDPENGGVELWKSDGTKEGTVLFKDIYEGQYYSNPGFPTDLNGTLYFSASGGSINGQELWKSDGTAEGTVLIKDIVAGSNGSWPKYLTDLNGTLYFSAYVGRIGYELWKSDGTEPGTVLVKDIYEGSRNGSSPEYLTEINGTLYFSATDLNGTELWKSDGTAEGTVLVKDINPEAQSSSPEYLTNLNGTLYFSADDGTNGRELWKSDGTASGTLLVKDIYVGGGDSFLKGLTNFNGTLFFMARDASDNTIQVFRSDGTVQGTYRISDAYTTSRGLKIHDSLKPFKKIFKNIDGKLYIDLVNTTTKYRELWITDGTNLGTHAVKTSTCTTDNY